MHKTRCERASEELSVLLQEIAALYCHGNNDPFYEVIKYKIIHDLQDKEDPWKNYKKITKDFKSKLWINADLDAFSLYIAWIEGKARNSQANPEDYLFAPHKQEPLLTFLRQLRKFIDKIKKRSYQRDLALDLFNELLLSLFEEVGFTKKEQKAFMMERELVPFKARNGSFSKRKPSRIPPDPILCKKIIELAIDKFIKTLNSIYIETLIYIWLAQSGAYQGKKTVTVKDVFAIRLQDVKTVEDIIPFMKGNRMIKKGKIAKNKKLFYVSSSLIRLIRSYVDKRSVLQSILSIERSSLENYIKELTDELGIDHTSLPITPETFLEKTSSFGRQCLTKNLI